MKELLRLLKDYRFFLWVFGFSLLLIGFSYQRYMKLQKTHKDIVSTQSAIHRMSQNVISAKGLSQDLQSIKSIDTAIQECFVDPNKKASNIAYFYALENTTSSRVEQVTQEAISLFKEQNKIKYYQIPYKMTLGGRFQEVLSYLESLQSGVHFFKLQEIAFTQLPPSVSGKIEDALQVSINFSLLGKIPKKEENSS